MKHVMVDLETWGTLPGSDLRSIGAVVFDPATGELGDEFYVNVDNPAVRCGYCQHRGNLEGCQNCGGDPDASLFRKYPLGRNRETVKWWADQSQEAQAILLTAQADMVDGLKLFCTWWSTVDNDPDDRARFWAHGPCFDETLLATAMRACMIVPPWHYRAPRDTRTIYEAAGGVDLPFQGIQHNALDDARHQARCVIEAYRRLGLSDDIDQPLGSEEAGFMIEAALQAGFEMSNGDGDRFRCTQAQIVDLMQRAVTAGKLQAARQHDARVTELLAANNREVERRRASDALLREAASVFRQYEHFIAGVPSETGRSERGERTPLMSRRIEAHLDGRAS